MCLHVGARGQCWEYSSIAFYLSVFWERVSKWTWSSPTHQDQLAGELQGSYVSASPEQRLHEHITTPGFFTWVSAIQTQIFMTECEHFTDRAIFPAPQSCEKVFIQRSLTYMSQTTIDIRMWLLENKFWHLRGHKSVLLMRYILCYIAIYVNMIFIYIQQQPQMTSMTWHSGNGHPKYRSHFIFTFTWHTSARYWPRRSILLAVNPINSSLMQNIQCTFSAYKKPWIMSTDYSSERPKMWVHVLFLLRGLTWKWSLPCLQMKYLKHCFDGPGYAWHICRFSQMRGVIRFGGQLR